MKNIFLTSIVIIFFTTDSFAQFNEGKIEFSLNGTGGSYKFNSSSNYSGINTSRTYLYLTTTVGYYVIDNISIEPQFGLFALKNSKPSQSIVLNVSYSKRIENSNVALFIRSGYGLGNAISSPFFYEIPIYRVANKWDVNIVNVGVGIKFIISEVAALKFETNYREESFLGEKDSEYFFWGNSDYSFDNMMLLIGISFYL